VKEQQRSGRKESKKGSITIDTPLEKRKDVPIQRTKAKVTAGHE
jgi:hypothetical protein